MAGDLAVPVRPGGDVVTPATGLTAPLTPVRAYTWPRETFATFNPYLYLFHSALARHGVDFCGGLEINDGWLAANTSRGDALIVHWGVDHFWRAGGPGAGRQARALAGLWRYFRLARRSGVRVVWVVHDLQPHERWGLADRLGYQLLARAADLCVVHSESALAAFTARYPAARGKCQMIGMGNYDGFYPPPALRATAQEGFGIPAGRRVLIAIGMIRPYKGLETAIAALDHLPAGYHLVIAGYASDVGYRDILARQAAARADVTFLPQTISDQEFANLHAVADAVLLPYRKITGSSALLAAFTLGCGVVASDLPYFRELTAAEPTAAEFCPPDDPAALAAAVERFFAIDPDARGAAARRLADRYPWFECAAPVADFLRTGAMSGLGTAS